MQALRDKRSATSDQIGALAKATFLDLFGDPNTNPKGFKVDVLEHTGHFLMMEAPQRFNPVLLKDIDALCSELAYIALLNQLSN